MLFKKIDDINPLILLIDSCQYTNQIMNSYRHRNQTTSFIRKETIDCNIQLPRKIESDLLLSLSSNTDDYIPIINSLSNEDHINILKYTIVIDNVNYLEKILNCTSIDLSVNDDILLCTAIINCSSECLLYLLDKGIPIDFCDNYAIRACCIRLEKYIYTTRKNKSSCDMLKIVIDRGGNVNTHNYEPLYSAVNDNNFDKIKLLVENGANKLSDFKRKITNTNLEIFQYLIDNRVELEVNFDDIFLQSIINDDSECMKLFIELGANINSIPTLELTKIIINARHEILEILINYGLDINNINDKINNEINDNRCEDYDETIKTVELVSNAGIDIINLLKVVIQNALSVYNFTYPKYSI
ncbi:putative ankyrin repeat protein R599 [Acanthamoeba castellanii mimivirus]|uniref:Putative ankyrin repeat protein R599 n=6 Tax=Mimivirus TaxID=315393 RepID=YR599_MIMIV|nr:RecName: Full=Putative ankyrin repeat protein R599 [Acanthamoeba polyphaga mimivirus]AHA45246.1 putative ankyrin repeat protein [Hirudovirus strain Sangsue]AHJ40237.1 ankyrin repeat protein [Samba virus]ALR84187.1 ankyrin repeat-containing protein [Niemeyer virus]AMZ03042.1 putative ankyrin repeat protein R599 [Mimivirus Bombay]BAV61714.1 putative ankyrin repeat protein R599 [Acanthamoeba castellanii mimivirus]